MKQKTISRHFAEFIQIFHIEQKDWTRLNVAKFLAKIAFWMPIYIIFGYLTISNSVDLIRQYQAKTIYLNMTAMINQPTATFPNYTICLYFNVTQVFDAADTLRRKNSNDSSYSEDLEVFFFEYGDTLQNGTSNFTMWPNTTNGVVVRYLIMMYELEALRDPAQRQFDYQQFQQINDDYWAAVRNVLVPKIAEYNITIDQLKATFQETLDSSNTVDYYDNCLFSLNVKKFEGFIENCMPSELISFIGRDSICFRLHSNDLKLGTLSNGADGTTYLIDIYGADSIRKNVLRWPFSLDFTGRSTPPPQTLPVNETDYVFFSKNEEVYYFNINITVLYVSQPGVEKTCSPDATKEECEYLCRSYRIKQLCGCAPITFSKNYASGTFANCTMDKYGNCSQHLANEDRNCSDKCVPNCAKWYYEFVVNSETYTWTFDLFIGALGGAIGIWLGLDFGVLTEFVFKPILMLLRKLLSFLGKGEEVEEEIDENDAEQKNCLQNIVQASAEYGRSRLQVGIWFFEKLFWTVLYTAGGILTAIYCWGLIQQYNFDQTQFNAAILYNKSITLPDARLCIDISNSPIYYSPNAADVGKEMVLTNALETYFNQTTAIGNRETFLDPKQNWTEHLLFVTYLYVGMMTEHEIINQYDIYDNIWYPAINGYEEYPSKMEIKDVENAFAYILIPKLREWNVSVDELLQKIGQQFHQILNVKITFYNASTSQNLTVLQNPRTEFIVQNQICYCLPMNEFLFTTDSDFFDISAHTYASTASPGTVEISQYSMMVDFSGSSFVQQYSYPFLNYYQYSSSAYYSFSGTVFKTLRDQMTTYSLAVESFYSSLSVVHGVQKCADQPTGSWLCRYAIIKKYCNCTPIANSLMSPPSSHHIPECTTQSYNICRILYSDIPIRPPECKTANLPQCKTWYLNILDTSVSKGSENEEFENKNEKTFLSMIRFFVKDFTYASIEERRAVTFQQFLAAFGGMLGIWLGLSFFSLVRILYFPAEMIFGFLLRKKNTRLSTIMDPEKNLQLKKMIHSRTFLIIEYIFDIKFDNFRKNINIQKLLMYPIMAVLFIAGIVETVAMCNDLYQKFSYGTTTSTIHFVNNVTFTLPSSTVCLPVNIADFKLIETQKNRFHEELVKENLFNFNNTDHLLNSNWSSSVLQLAFEHLSLYAQIERMGNYENFLKTPILVNGTNAADALFLNNWTAIQYFDHRVLSLKITAEELKQKCGNEFKKLISINVQHFNKTNNTRYNSYVNLVRETTFISETTICYKLQLDEITFFSKKEGISLFVNRELFPDFKANSSITIDLNGRDSNLNQGSNTDGSILTSLFGEYSLFQLKIGAFYIASSYSNGAVKCSADETLEDCQDNCRIAMIQKYCNCTPVSWSKLSTTKNNFCSLDDYMNCFQFSSTNGEIYLDFQNDSSICSLKCLSYCTTIKYQQNLQISATPINQDQAEVHIKILQFPYFVYSEYFAYTFSYFLSEFGGCIGLWVGLDFLILMHIIYYTLCIFLRLILLLIKKAVIADQEDTLVESLDGKHGSSTSRTIFLVQNPNNIALTRQMVVRNN